MLNMCLSIFLGIMLFSSLARAKCYSFIMIKNIAINSSEEEVLERALIREKNESGLNYKKIAQDGYFFIYSGRFSSRNDILAIQRDFSQYVERSFSDLLAHVSVKPLEIKGDEDCQKFPPFSWNGFARKTPDLAVRGGDVTPNPANTSKPGLIGDKSIPETPGTIIVKPNVDIDVDVGHPPIVMPTTYETDESVPYEVQEQTFRRLVNPANGFAEALAYCKAVSQRKSPLLGFIKYALEFDVPVDYMQSGSYIFKEYGQPGHSYIIIECHFKNDGKNFVDNHPLTLKFCRKELDGLNVAALPTGDKNEGECGGVGAGYSEANERLRYRCYIGKRVYTHDLRVFEEQQFSKNCNF